MLAAAAALAACGSSKTPATETSAGPASSSVAQTTSAPPTLTASALQPPSQDNKYTRTSGRPKVTFDPCTWLPDDAISKIGYDPATRKRGNDIAAEYTFLTCDFNNRNAGLQLDSGNISLDEDGQKYSGKSQNVTVDGRKALLTPNKTESNDCSLDIQTKSGYFGINVIVNTYGDENGVKPCDHITDIGTALEPYIGKDD